MKFGDRVPDAQLFEVVDGFDWPGVGGYEIQEHGKRRMRWE
jgi:hypothetical protein